MIEYKTHFATVLNKHHTSIETNLVNYINQVGKSDVTDTISRALGMLEQCRDRVAWEAMADLAIIDEFLV
jgi:hypothetical protein